MGLFDGVLNNNNALSEVMALVQSHGGLQQVVESFKQNGLVNEVHSWIGNGNNLLITAEHVQQVFNPEALQQLAAKLGIPPEQANAMIAKVLPEIVNHLTPQGNVPENHADILSQGLAFLK